MGKSQRCPNSCVLAVLGVTAAAILTMVVYLGVTKLGDSTSSGNANAGHQVSLSSFGASASTIDSFPVVLKTRGFDRKRPLCSICLSRLAFICTFVPNYVLVYVLTHAFVFLL